jgi:hypothetical protein
MVAGLPEDHDPLRMIDGQEPQNNLIQQAEHRRVRAHTQRQRGHRHQTEPRILRERSYTVPNILRQPVQADSRANIANILPYLVDSAHFATRCSPGFFRRHPGSNFLLCLQLQIRPEFLIEIAIESLSAEQILPQRAKSTDHRAS